MSPQRRDRTIHVEDLIGAAVEDASGKRVGRVVDVEVRPKDDWEIVGLVLGRHSFLDRMDLFRAVAYRLGGPGPLSAVPWSDVESFQERRIRLRPGAGSSDHREGGSARSQESAPGLDEPGHPQ